MLDIEKYPSFLEVFFSGKLSFSTYFLATVLCEIKKRRCCLEIMNQEVAQK